MLKLCSNNIYLATLEKEHCRQIWDDFEYDFKTLTEPLNIGHSSSKALIYGLMKYNVIKGKNISVSAYFI